MEIEAEIKMEGYYLFNQDQGWANIGYYFICENTKLV